MRSTPFRFTVASILLLVTLRIPLFVWGDSWFNLVLGREVAQSGILRSNDTTAVAWGVPLVDVQWLAHWLFYVAALPFDMAGVVVLAVLLIITCFVGGAGFAVWQGATAGRTLLTTLMVFSAMGGQLVLRAQTLAYPFLLLFPAVLWLDTQAPARRTWWLVPAAALWANLHGSVLLAPIFAGALLVGRQVERWRRGLALDWRVAGRDAALVAALAAAVFATPYGLDVWTYYADTAGSAAFREYITEWYPLWAAPDIASIVLLGGVAVALWRARRETHAYTLLVLSGLGIMLVSSVRHATPFALAVLVLLPPVLDRALSTIYPVRLSDVSTRVGRTAVVLTLAFAVIGIPLLTERQAARWRPTPLLQQVAASAHPGQCLLIDEQQADRLLWYFPQLKGIVAHDVRVETLPMAYLRELGAAYASLDSPWAVEFFRQFPTIVLDRRLHGGLIGHLERDLQFTSIGIDSTVAAFHNNRADRVENPCERYSTS